jgi:rhomboid protease GluP
VGVRDDKCYTCGRSNPGLWGFGPALRQLGASFGFADFVIGASSVLYLLSLLMSGSELQVASGGMSFLVPGMSAVLKLGASGKYAVFDLGWYWTLLSASWLHGSFLHILFNMMWVRDLGPALVDLIGTPRTVIIYIVSGIAGFLLSSTLPLLPVALPIFHGAQVTLGASAAIFGLLGALVHYGSKSGSSYIRGQALNYAIILFVMGLIMPGVDNSAHAGGFIGGYGMSMIFNPLTRERGDHMIVALLLLVATAGAIALSLLSGFGILNL